MGARTAILQESRTCLEFHILGAVGARLNGENLSLGGAKQRTVLAALLLAEGRVVPDERLVSFLWNENPPSTVDAQIYTYISRLRRQFRDRVEIVRYGQGYSMSIGSAYFDCAEFHRLSVAGLQDLAAQRYALAAEKLAAALDLWQGPVLSDVTEYLAREEACGLEEAYLRTLEGRIDADLALGSHSRLTAELHRLIARHPLRERFRGQLMVALSRSGRQAEALAVYHQGRQLLSAELGVDPDPFLRRTYERILRGDLGTLRTWVPEFS